MDTKLLSEVSDYWEFFVRPEKFQELLGYTDFFDSLEFWNSFAVIDISPKRFIVTSKENYSFLSLTLSPTVFYGVYGNLTYKVMNKKDYLWEMHYENLNILLDLKNGVPKILCTCDGVDMLIDGLSPCTLSSIYTQPEKFPKFLREYAKKDFFSLS